MDIEVIIGLVIFILICILYGNYSDNKEEKRRLALDKLPFYHKEEFKDFDSVNEYFESLLGKETIYNIRTNDIRKVSKKFSFYEFKYTNKIFFSDSTIEVEVFIHKIIINSSFLGKQTYHIFNVFMDSREEVIYHTMLSNDANPDFNLMNRANFYTIILRKQGERMKVFREDLKGFILKNWGGERGHNYNN